MSRYIRWFKDLTIKDIPLVGGKNASLGEMYGKLTSKGLPVPNGFALTSDAYWAFLKENKLDKKIKSLIHGLDVKNLKDLSYVGAAVRRLILNAEFPAEMVTEIEKAYQTLSRNRKITDITVAVRSSATAEDLPDASFAGQQESYLNVHGKEELLIAAKKCLASLFTDRAISYREAKGFDHLAVALSIGIQEMVRSDRAASGVMFTIDTESGFNGVVLINASYGLGENIVKGRVTPDQFFVYKQGVKQGLSSVISHRLGSKETKVVLAAKGVKQERVKKSDQERFCLTDAEVVQLAKWGMQIEEHYGRAMDIEWAKDGVTGKLFIVQARSETVKSQAPHNVIETYRLTKKSAVLATGVSVGQKIGQGKVHIISSPKQMKEFKTGEVLVTRMTDPDWEPIMRIASAIITEQGGKTSHAAIVSRELGVPCIVGANKARQLLSARGGSASGGKKAGIEVTVSCADGEVGSVYKGRLPFEVDRVELKKLEPIRTKVMMNIGDPDKAFALSAIPSDGVGLAREEFIYTNFIKIHPLALIHYKELKDKEVKRKIDELTMGYSAQGGSASGGKDKRQYAIDKLAEGIAAIAAGFEHGDVILRFSDFKTNEYATLLGGAAYEPKEENPMLGWRGASRYYDPAFKPAFQIECEAIKKVREEWGLKNVIVMVPFCRTVEEGKQVLATMKEFGLERGKNGLQVYVMCEIPANVILAKEFSEIFDGFSIGSNDLTQLTLGVDRDSALVSHVYNENDLAVKKLIREVIQTAHQYKRKVGICGQAPSDYPEFAEFLVQEGIDSISLNPDTILKTRGRIAAMEKKIGVRGKGKKLPHGVKTASFIGVLFLSLLLVGFTCQTVSNQDVAKQIQTEVADKVAAAKVQIQQEIEAKYKQKYQDEVAKAWLPTFTVSCLKGWKVEYRGGDLYCFGPSNSGNTQWFSVAGGVFLTQQDRYVFLSSAIVTSTIGKYTALSYTTSAPSEIDLTSRVVDIFSDVTNADKIMFELKGDPKHFDEIFKTFVIEQ